MRGLQSRTQGLAVRALRMAWLVWLCFWLAAAGPAGAQTYTWSTLAGPPGGPGSTDGAASDARFYQPSGLAMDGSGNVYVADTTNHKIRKITSAGVVSTLAGTGISGFADGVGSAANFASPNGVAVDASGTVYVADTGNHRIRKITSAGVVSTLAGSGSAGFVDGSGSTAKFSSPYGLAVDGSGNVYVTDSSNNRIRKVTSAGAVSTLAGSGVAGFADGAGGTAKFSQPTGITVDASGTVYVTDTGNHRIRKITSAGVASTLAGSGVYGSTDGTGTAALFNSPRGVVVDGSGDLYVSDAGSQKIRKVTSAGVVTTLAGDGNSGFADGTGSAARFYRPDGIAVDGGGNVYVADYSNQIIRKVTSAGVVTTFAGAPAASGLLDATGGAARFYWPSGLAVDSSGNAYVADANNRIRKITSAGAVSTLAGSGVAGFADGAGSIARFANPSGVAVDGSGSVYVADTNNHKIRKITSAGVVSTFAGSGVAAFADGTGSLAKFANPNGVAVDANGNVYVADTNNHKIRKITSAGEVSTLAGGTSGFADGAGGMAKFSNPRGVAVDGSGNVFVADFGNHRIRKITSAGVVSTLAGSGVAGFADGAGSTAKFSSPMGAAVDAGGTVYVADTGGNRVRKITEAGVVVTIGGAGVVGSTEGAGVLALFSNPKGVAVDGGGNVIVSDTDNNKIRYGAVSGLPLAITTQPTGTTVLQGAPASFTVVATGTAPLSYQWRLGGVAVSGGTATTLSIPSAQPVNAGTYDVVVTDTSGSVTSNAVVLGVNTPPSISTQPTDKTVLSGSLASFSVTAGGTAPLTYQWAKDGANISGGTGTTLSISSSQLANAGSYNVTVTNAFGSATSGMAKLTVNEPAAIVTPPVSLAVASGTSVVFSVTASGTPPLSYQWKKNGASILGGTSASYTIPSAATTDAGTYTVTVANAFGSVTTGGTPITKTVVENGTITLPAGAGIISALYGDIGGTNVTFDITAGVAAMVGAGQLIIPATNAAWGDPKVGVGKKMQIVYTTGALLTVYTPVTITTPPASLTVNTGSSAAFSVTATGSTPLKYQWQKGGADIAGATSGTYTISSALATHAGGYTVVVLNPAGSLKSGTATLTVNTPVAITTQPASLTVTSGSSASFSVTATGTAPLTYQWKKDGSIVNGGTGASLTIGTAAAVDAGSYNVVVTNPVGSVSSGSAKLTVNTPVSISSQPSNLTVLAGSPATFSVSATGTAPISYQWKKNGVNLPGATGSSYTISATTSASAGTYTVVVTNPAGSVTSGNAVLTVNTLVSITGQPTSLTVVTGSSATFSVTATGSSPLTYQWQKGGVDINGGTASSYTIGSAQTADAGTYKVTVTNPAGSVSSGSATLTVNTPVTITSQPADMTVVVGSSASFSVTATGTPKLSYQWKKNGANISTGTSATFSISSALSTSAGSYSVVVTNPAGSVTSGVANLTVNTPVNITKQPVSLSVDAGTLATFSVTATGTAPLSYQWFKDGSTLSGGTSASLDLANVQSVNAGSYNVVVTNPAGSVSSGSASLKVSTPPYIIVQPGSLTVTAGTSATLSVTAGGVGPFTYQWLRNGVNLTSTYSSVVGNKTWLEAKADAESKGGHLLTLTSAAEYSKVKAQFGLTMLSDTWMGGYTKAPGNKVLTGWVWVTGEPWSYSNWSPNEPNYSGGKEIYLHLYSAGTWNDLPLSYSSIKGYILEKESTSPSFTIPSAQTSDAGDYQVLVFNSEGCVGSTIVKLTVNTPVTILTQPASLTVNTGSQASFSVKASGTAPLTYQWQKGGVDLPGATTSSYLIPSAIWSDAGDYNVVVTNPAGSLSSGTAVLTVKTVPVILTQPAGTSVNAGDSATLSVAVGGPGPFTYQWRKGGVNLAGATGSTYVIPTVTSAQEGNYDVVVTNTYGSVTSNAAAVVLNTGVTILTQPAGATVNPGVSKSLSVLVSGTPPITYQWRKDGVNLSGGTQATYTINPTQALSAGSYDVVVANPYGTATSFPALLNVNTGVTITGQPVPLTVNPGTLVTFAVTATGTEPLTYQWKKAGASIAGATAATYTINPVQAGDAGSYSVSVTNVVGAVSSTSALLSVNVAPVIASHPANVTVVSGGTATFSVGASGTAPLAYQWRKDGVNIVGGTSSSYTLSPAWSAFEGSYSVVVSNVAGEATSNAATLKVSTPPVIVTQPQGVSINQGSNGTLSVEVSGSSPFTYQWRKGGVAVAGATSSTYSIVSAQALQSGSYDVVVTNSFGNITSEAVSVVVNTPVNITKQPSAVTVTAGDSATLTVVAEGTAPITYQWRLNGEPVSGAKSAAYTVSPAQTSHAGNYDVVVGNVLGEVTSTSALLTVNEPVTITKQPSGATVNEGNSAAFKVEVTGTGPTVYQWFKDGVAIVGAKDPIFSISAVQASDAGSYTVEVTNVAGKVTSAAAVLALNTAVVIKSQPSGLAVNQGSSATFNVVATGTEPLMYQWRKGGVNISGANSQSLTVSGVQAADLGFYDVLVSNIVGSVDSSSAELRMNIAPAITKQPVAVEVNEGEPVTLSVEATGTAPLSYQWKKNGTVIRNATDASIRLASPLAADSGVYTVVVSNMAGTVISAEAVLKVYPPLQIIEQPVTVTVALGAPATLSVRAIGADPIVYQWRKEGVDLPGATGASYALPAAGKVDIGSYSVVLTDRNGTLTSDAASIFMIGVPSGAWEGLLAYYPGDGDAKDAGPFKIHGTQRNGAGFAVDRFGVAGMAFDFHGVNQAVVLPDSPILRQARSISLWFKGDVNSGLSNGQLVSRGDSRGTTDPVLIGYRNSDGGLVAGAKISGDKTVASTATPAAWHHVVFVVDDAEREARLYVDGAKVGSLPNYPSIDVGLDSGMDPGWAFGNHAGALQTVFNNQFNGQIEDVKLYNRALGESDLRAINGIVTKQPVSLRVVEGASATFTVESSGLPPVTYQWRKNGVNIPGATTAAFMIAATDISDMGGFDVVVGCATGAVTSNTATLTVVSQGATTPLSIYSVVSGDYTWAQARADALARGGHLATFSGDDEWAVMRSQLGTDVNKPLWIGGYQVAGSAEPSGGWRWVTDEPFTYNRWAVGEPNNSPHGGGVGEEFLFINAPGQTSSQKDWNDLDNASHGLVKGYVLEVDALTILTHPQSQALDNGLPVELKVVAAGLAPLTYQWRKNGTDVLGATGDSLRISVVTSQDEGNYDVVVRSATGSVTSNVARLSVNVPVVITRQPVSLTVNPSSLAKFEVEVTGSDPLYYQWVKDGLEIPNATAASYSIPSAQAANAGEYRVIVTNVCGSVVSDVAVLALNTPVTITSQPVKVSGLQGDPALLNVTAEGTPPLSYQWYLDGVPINYATDSSYAISALSDTTIGVYTVKVSNVVNSVTSVGAQASIDGAPVIVTSPTYTVLSFGLGGALSAVVRSSSLFTYQWKKNGELLGAPVSNAGGKSNVPVSYQFSNALVLDEGLYSIVVTNAQGSVESVPAEVRLDVAFLSATLSKSGQMKDLTTCVNNGSIDLTGLVVANDLLEIAVRTSSTATYSWSYASFKGGGYSATGQTTRTLDFSAFSPVKDGWYAITVTQGKTSKMIKFIVRGVGASLSASDLVITTQPSDVSLPSVGMPADFSVVASGTAPITYQWRRSGLLLAGKTERTLSIPAASLSDTGLYDVVIKNPTGTLVSGTARLSVSTPPVINQQPASLGLNPGRVAAFNVTASGTAPLSYQWRKDGVPILGATSASYSVLGIQASSAGVYDVIVSNSVGNVTSAGATLVVNQPVTIKTHPASVNVNPGASATLSVVAGGTAPITCKWRKDGVEIPGATLTTLTLSSMSALDAGQYDVVLNNPVGSVTSNYATVSVNSPVVIVTPPGSLTVSPGAAASFSVVATGGAPILYQWRKGGVALTGGTASSYVVDPVHAEDAGDYDVVVSNIVGSVTSATGRLFVNTPVTITTQPSGKTVDLGGRVELTVSAAGTSPLTYQWRLNGANIAGATASSFIIPAAKKADAGSYDVVVTNVVGSVVSDAAAVAVNVPPSIVTHPSGSTVNPGSNVTFSVVAEGTGPLLYQWRKGGVPIDGAGEASFMLNPAQLPDAGSYDVTVSNALGSVASNTAVLNVNRPVTITAHPAGVVLNPGLALKMSVTAEGTAPLTYQWRKDGVAISGAVGATFEVGGVQASDAGLYDVVVTNVVGSVTSNSAQVGVNTPVTIVTQPSNVTVSEGAAATLSVVVQGTAPITYQWRQNGNPIFAATTASYTIVSAKDSEAGSYDVVVENVAGKATSDKAVVVVNKPVVITSQPLGGVLNPGDSLTLNIAATGTAPITYQWRKDGAVIAGATAASYTLASVGGAHAGTYDVIVTNVVGSVTSSAAAVALNTGVTILTDPSNLTVNAGAGAAFSVTASGTGPLSYQWRKGGVEIPGATGSSYTIQDVSESSSGIYDVVVRNIVGSVTSQAALLSVNVPVRILTHPAGKTLNLGGALNLEVVATGTNPMGYQWRKSGVNISGGTASSYSVASVQEGDTGSYDVVVSNVVGEVTSRSAIVNVNLPVVITGQPKSIAVNQGAPSSLSVAVSGSEPITYQWRKGGVEIQGATGSSYGIPAAAQADSGDYDVVVTNPVGSVVSSVATLTVNTPPQITSQPAGVVVNPNAPFTLSVTATGVAPLTYQWRKGGIAISGATGSLFSVTSAQTGDAGSYDVLVSNAAGSVSSTAALVGVNQPLVILTQPEGGSVVEGSALALRVTAAGTGPLSYQWSKDGTVISGATSISYSASSAGSYTVLVRDSLATLTSSAAVVTVTPRTTTPSTPDTSVTPATAKPVVVKHPVNTTVNLGAYASVQASVKCTAVFWYQWLKNGKPVAGPAYMQGGGDTPVTVLLERKEVVSADEGLYTLVVAESSAALETSTARSRPGMILLNLFFGDTRLLTKGVSYDLSRILTFNGSVDLVGGGFNAQGLSVGSLSSIPKDDTLQVSVRSTGRTQYFWNYTVGKITYALVDPANLDQNGNYLPNFNTSALNFSKLYTYPLGATAPVRLEPRKGTYKLFVYQESRLAASTSFNVKADIFGLPEFDVEETISLDFGLNGLTVPEGKSADFYVGVSGPVRSYTWYKVGTATPVSGPSSLPYYYITSVVPADEGDYRVVVAGPNGSVLDVVPVHLSVTPPGD